MMSLWRRIICRQWGVLNTWKRLALRASTTRSATLGERSLRRLLILGASSVVKAAARSGARDPWLARVLARKPRMLVTVALANKTARIVWALMAHGRILQSSDRGGRVATAKVRDVEEAGRS